MAGARQRELLALLLLDAGHVVSSDRLMDELWGERQPAAGATALRVRVSQLRKALRAGGDVLVTRPPGYALLVPRDGLDLWRFERGLDEGERALATRSRSAPSTRSRAALGEWRGPPLADVAYAPFAQAAIVRLEELRASALELRIEAELALGRHARLIGELQGLVGEHPLRERLWAQLMTALYRDGRQADALAAYRAARERLVEEIGIEPGPELRALEARILAQDPELAHPATRRPAPPARAALAVCTRRERPGRRGRAARGGLGHRGGGGGAGARRRASWPPRPRSCASAAPGARVAAFTSEATRRGRGAARRRAGRGGPAARGAEDGRARPELAAVLRAAACDVALRRRRRAASTEGPVLVPFSGSAHDWAAAELGASLGGGAVTLLGVSGGRAGATRAACWPARRSRSSAAPACAPRRCSPATAPTACSRPPPAPPPS